MATYKGRYFILTGVDPAWEEFEVKTLIGTREPGEIIHCSSIKDEYFKLKYYPDQFEKSLEKGKIVPKIGKTHIQHLIDSEYVGGFEIRREFDIVTDKTPEEILIQEDK